MNFLSDIFHAVGLDTIPGLSQVVQMVETPLQQLLPPEISSLLDKIDVTGLLSSLGAGSGLGGLVSALCPELGLALAAADAFGHLLGYFGTDIRNKAETEKSSVSEAETQTEIQQVLHDPSLSVEEKMLRLAALLSTLLDKRTEKLMEDWTREVDKDTKTDKEKRKQAHKSQVYQMQIQDLNNRKNQLMTIISNLLRSMNQVNMSIVRNVA